MERIDILNAAQRDALNHAEVWLDIAAYLENEIDQEENGNPFSNRTMYDADGNQFTYTGDGRQGDDLPRNGERKQPVRYYRGSTSSDTRTL